MVRSPLLAALALLTVGAVALPIGARADSYGEIGHFGSSTQFHLTGATTGTNGTRAFGVDVEGAVQAENAVYIGDEPKAKEYRVQRFSEAGTLLAATPIFKPPARDGIEGIAFDPVLKRLYVLALEKHTDLKNATVPVAGTLYAYDTQATGGTLEPASGTVEGVLAGPTTLLSTSTVPGQALVRPKGIAVDPTTHDVIIAAEAEEGEEAKSFMLQRIDASSGQLGERYVDHSGMLSVGEQGTAPNSPIVSAEGAVIVEQRENLAEPPVANLVRVPSRFSSGESPVRLLSFIAKGALESEANSVVEFANASGGPSLESGGALALVVQPNPKDSTVYAEARVFESSGSGGNYYVGVLAFSDIQDSSGFELGFSGGQSEQASSSCAVGVGGVAPPMIAAGSGEKVFILDSAQQRVHELGPGGSGCPTAQASELAATVGGVPISGQIQAGTEVTLTSNLTRANALSVEWSFGEGEAKALVVEHDEYQHTEITHKFEKGGELAVTETIHTDDLATPIIVKQITIPVNVKHLSPQAVLVGPSVVAVQEAASFDGSASWDPNGEPGSSPIESYRWEFGDGDSLVSQGPEVQHTYTHTGVYVASLVVVNSYGLESQPKQIDVTVAVAPPQAPSGSQGGGSGSSVLTGPPVSVTPDESGSSAGTTGPTLTAPTGAPVVSLQGGASRTSASGVVSLRLSCPAVQGQCKGTIVLRTTKAVETVVRRAHGRPQRKKVVLTLAQAAFTIAPDRERTLSVQLSKAGRALLAKSSHLNVNIEITAHDAAGVSRITRTAATLRAIAPLVHKSQGR